MIPTPGTTRHGERYGLVLVLITASLVAEALRGVVSGAGLARVVLSALTLLLVLRTTREPARSRAVDLLGAAAVVATGVPADLVGPVDSRLAWSSAVTVVVVAVQIALIGRRVARHRRVALSTAGGVLAMYLLLGLLFAGGYGLVAGIAQTPVFASGTDGTAVDRLYFSLVTLTTTGYGDLVPGTDLVRMTAVLEALAGQLYLVTVVAVVIGNLPRGRAEQGG